MATVTREQIGTLHEKLTVKLEKADFMPAFEKTLKQYAKTANIPGFRKGMVPQGLLRKMAGQSIYNEEIIRTAGKQLEDYMKNERLTIFGQPMIMADEDGGPRLDMNRPEDVNLSFEVGLKPDFEIPAIKNKAHLIAYKIPVTDKMLDDELERIQRRFGNVDSREEVTSTEDVIYCTFQKSDADGNVTDEQKIEETVLLDKMPTGLKDQLMNKIPGSVVVFKPSEVCSEEELPKFLKDPLKATDADADQYYLLTITKIGHLVPMEMGVELYSKVFPNEMVTEEAAFRDMVRQEIQVQYDRLGRERYHNEIFELLVHSTPIPLPVTFLKRWLKEGGEKPKTELEVDEEFGQFEHQLRWQLISDQLIAENNLQVTREDVANNIKQQVLSYYGIDTEDGDEAPWMTPYMDKVMKDEKMVDETYRRMLTDRIFAFLENQFNTELKEVDEETFFKLPSAHAAHHHHH